MRRGAFEIDPSGNLFCAFCGEPLDGENTLGGRAGAWIGHAGDCPERMVLHTFQAAIVHAVEGEAAEETASPARASVKDMKDKKPAKQAAPSPATGTNGGMVSLADLKEALSGFGKDLAGDVSQTVGLAVRNAIEAAGGKQATAPQADPGEDTGSVVEVSEDDDGDSKASRYRAAVKAGHQAEKRASGKKEEKAVAGYTEMARLLLADEGFEAKNQASITMENGSVWTDNLLHLTWRRQAAPEFNITTGQARNIEAGLVMSGSVEGREGA